MLGYIFEKYVNQKQMGAYYTKEDITGYIARNTIIPFLFDAAEEESAHRLQARFSAVWRLLRDDPDRYIYPAVKHGVIRDDGSVVPESELPDFVQNGMHDPKARMFDKRYNLQQAPAGDPIRLVTETWREYVYRRNRCLEIREKLQPAGVHEINDLDHAESGYLAIRTGCDHQLRRPRTFACFLERNSACELCSTPPAVPAPSSLPRSASWRPLYSDCLERMERFVEDLEGKKHHPEQFSDFKKVLEQIAKHPNDATSSSSPSSSTTSSAWTSWRRRWRSANCGSS
ncbi:MAG: hypothetical protein KatS3mg109_0903 [Pirellulaceae bacterium]|nr:MAG: hypothetical protein KatS3mg109_0903 [Pirellulaceae bacterium]